MKINFPYKPFWYQAKIHRSNVRFKVICGGRRVGKTTLAAAEAFFEIFGNPFTGKYRKDWKPKRGWIVGPNYGHTQELEREFLKLVDPILIKSSNKTLRLHEFITGDIIEFKSADSGALSFRGAGLDWVIIDEASFVKEEAWLNGIRPALSDKQGRAIIISTPAGRTWFHTAFKRGLSEDPEYAHYKSWHFPTSVNPKIPASEIEDARRELPEMVFRQEYLAEFTDNVVAVFRKITEAVRKYPLEIPRKGQGTIGRIGVDVAKKRDYTVISVIQKIGLKDRLAYFERFNNLDWTIIESRILDVYRKCGYPIVLDATGVGDPVYDHLVRQGATVKPYQFTNESKRIIVQNLSIKFDKNMVEIPDDKGFIDELTDFEATISESGTIKYGAPTGLHDDRVYSLALGVWDMPLCDYYGDDEDLPERRINSSGPYRTGIR